MVMKGRKKVRAPGAVILMELGEGKGSARSHVKYFAALYEGEWWLNVIDIGRLSHHQR